MFAIYGGKAEFNQWDLNQLVTNPCMKEGDEVVFKGFGKAYETTAYSKNGEVVADVPNFLLQEPYSITVDLGWGLHVNLECRTVFNVVAKEKPDDYNCGCNIEDRSEKNNGSGGVSSWNDLTDKPFGEETGMVEVLAETILDMSSGDTTLPTNIGLVDGEEYTVVWKGTRYTCTAFIVEEDGVQLVCLGDVDGGDTHTYPFIISEAPADIADAFGFAVAISCWDEGMIPIAIYTEGTVITPIEGKYLPKGLQIGEEDIYIIPETTLNFEPQPDFYNLTGAVLTVPEDTPDPDIWGETIINYNGIDYKCPALVPGGGGEAYLGNLALAAGLVPGAIDTGEPFFIMWMTGSSDVWAILPKDGNTPATFSARITKAKPIEYRYTGIPVLDLYSLGLVASGSDVNEIPIDVETERAFEKAAQFGIAKIIIGINNFPYDFVATYSDNYFSALGFYGTTLSVVRVGHSVSEKSLNAFYRNITISTIG